MWSAAERAQASGAADSGPDYGKCETKLHCENSLRADHRPPILICDISESLMAWTGGPCGSAGKFRDAEGEVPVPHPVAGEAHRDHARSFQPVRHFQAADVQRAEPEALDERRHARLGLRIVASDEDVGTALLQDMTEDGVECLHHAGAGRGRLGDFLRDRGVLAVTQPVARGIAGVAYVDDDLARVGVS